MTRPDRTNSPALLLAAESERALTAEERLEQMTKERDEARAQLAAIGAIALRDRP